MTPISFVFTLIACLAVLAVAVNCVVATWKLRQKAKLCKDIAKHTTLENDSLRIEIQCYQQVIQIFLKVYDDLIGHSYDSEITQVNLMKLAAIMDELNHDRDIKRVRIQVAKCYKMDPVDLLGAVEKVIRKYYFYDGKSAAQGIAIYKLIEQMTKAIEENRDKTEQSFQLISNGLAYEGIRMHFVPKNPKLEGCDDIDDQTPEQYFDKLAAINNEIDNMIAGKLIMVPKDETEATETDNSEVTQNEEVAVQSN